MNYLQLFQCIVLLVACQKVQKSESDNTKQVATDTTNRSNVEGKVVSIKCNGGISGITLDNFPTLIEK